MASILLLLSCTWLVFLGKIIGQPPSLSDCTDGFISQDLSTALQSDSLTIPYEQQRIIPGINFNCSGAITSWTIGAEWRTGGMHNFFPHLQIWRNASICGANTYILAGDTELFVPDSAGLVTQNDYVFTGTADPVLKFQAGDILGLFQPRESRSRVRVYYDTSAGPTNYYNDIGNAEEPPLTSFVITNADGMEDHLPLVTIEIGPSTAEPIEVYDYELLNETEVTTTLQSTSLTIPYEQQRIIPGIPLNCSGTITSWTIGAEWRTGGMHNFFPHLQLWRSIVDGCSYTLVGDTQLFVPDSGELVTQTDYVFSGTPAPAVGFQAGDILGLFQPRESRSRVRVYYDTSTGPTNYYNDIGNADEPPSIQDQEDFLIITADGMENGLPLLAIEITIDCDPLANPENGAVVITTIASDSLTAIYSCSPGYELAGEEVRDCNCQNTGGVWTGMPPTCMLIDCGGLTVPMDGQLTFTPGVVESVDTGLNATATYTCSEGYSLAGDAMRTCQADSQWDGVEPICTLIDCGGLTDPESGQVTISPGIVAATGLNAVAMYTCNDGYDLVGDTMRTCQSDAQWNGTEPVCMIIDCGGLTDPESGQITISPGVIVIIDTGLDAVAAYSCNVGYDLVGAEMRTCQSGGHWDGAEPTCMARSGICILGSTEVPETNFLDESGSQYLDFGNPAACNGNLTAWHFCYYAADIDQSDTYVVFFRVWRASEGNSFDLIDTYTLSMAIDPPSNGPTLICENVTLSTPLDIQRNDILGVYTPALLVRPLHIVARDTTTNFGIFADTRNGITTFFSQSTTTDNLENRTTLGLHLYADIVIICDDLPDPADGQLTFTPGVVVTIDTGLGAVATYTCTEGYSLVGDAIRTCQETGQWNGAEPTCLLIDCGNLNDPESGQVTFTPGVVPTIQTGLDAVANYTCSEGYDLVGDEMRNCQANGQWTGAEPNCMLIDCGNLTDPEGGHIMFTPGVVATTDSGLDAVATYSCNEGYNLTGDEIRTCQGSGQWDGTAPNCILIDCGGLTDPEGGQVTFTPGVITTIDTGLGAVATYSCNASAGFFDIGLSSVRTCQDNGLWSGVAEICTRCDFNALTDPENGGFGITTIGGDITASYICNMGYQLVGDEFITCQSTGEFSGQEPICIVIDCGNLTDPEGGQVTFTPGVVTTIETGLDAVAAYTCDQGYDLVGDEMRTCQANELWDGAEPNCTLIDCGNLTDPENGQVTFTPGVVATTETGLNAIATYACSEGYNRVGDEMRTCQENSIWDGAAPVCMSIDCDTLNDPENGQVTFTPGVVVTIQTGLDAVANYTCGEGYDLVGDEMRTCQTNGQWTGTEPNCMLIDCGNLTDPEGGQIMFTPGVVATTDSGLDAVATYSCNVGYNLTGDGIRTCQGSGQWDGAAPNCILIDCGGLTDPEDGHVTFTPGVVTAIETGLDAVAAYTCDQGYDLVGDEMRTCQANEQWTGAEPNCMLIDCGNLTDPESGQVTFTPGVVTTIDTGLDAVAAYTCDQGYDLVGDEMRTCQENQQWTVTEPNCTLIDCGGLTDPEGGQVTFTPGVVATIDTGLDAVAAYTCNQGYDLVGGGMRTCQANGQWTVTEPNCTLIECGGLTDPEGGQVTFTPGVVATTETGLGAVATYTCSEGYDLGDNETRSCQANSQWNGAEPICTLIDCGNLPNPENGLVTITPGVVAETGVGALATYTCSEGYELIGNGERTCRDTGDWNQMAPTCMLIDCGNLEEPENGTVTINPGVVPVAPTGLDAVATYACNNGSNLIGIATRTCQPNGDWDGTEPTCISGPLPTSTQILDQTPSQTPTPPPTDSSTTVASSTGPQTGSNIGLVAGAAAGGVIGILVVVVAAIILVLLYRRRKRGIYKIPYGQPQDDHILANPLYQAPTEARGQDIHGFKNPLYQVPGAGDDNTLAIKRLANTQLNAMDLDGDYEDIGGEIEHYELAPLASPAVKTGFVDNPVYGGAEIGATTKFNLSSSLEASMEWGIRVPTQELRNSLERSKPVEGNPYAVYSTLLECSEQTKETQEAEQQEFFQEEDIYWVPASTSEDLYSQLAQRKYREILRNQITLGEKLGAGQFGTVNKGAWQSPDGPVKVAVKTLKEGASEQDRVKFLQEAAISGQFHHPNVITLHGVVTVGEPAMLILELMSESDMRVFFIQERPRLQEAAPPEVAKLCLEFCQQIASGMEYLSRKAFIHRDLAARNILLSKNRICKIADFGMARDLEDENYYIAHGGQIPVKWTAPEALNFKKFSTASDVWSFGVLMYEIWSLGHKPFEGYTNQQAMLMIAQSQRLPPPPGCPKAIYSTMIKCWHPETSSRPTFTDLQQILSDTDNLLSWSEEDTKVHPQAAVLGAPLDAGKNLYPELQRTYM